MDDVAEVDRIAQREMDITKERIQKILASGANVVMTTKGIDDVCLKYFVEAGCMAIRRCKKEDLRRLGRATGGSLVSTMADMEGNENFDTSNLGTAESCSEERVGDGELLYVRGCATARATTVVLRGANECVVLGPGGRGGGRRCAAPRRVVVGVVWVSLLAWGGSLGRALRAASDDADDDNDETGRA